MKTLLLGLAGALLTVNAYAATTPLNVVEKSAHKLAALVNQKKIDASFATDITSLNIATSVTEMDVTLLSPSADPQIQNQLVLKFDINGAFQSFTSDFKSASAQSPIFKAGNSSALLDLGAEAVVDHLKDSTDMPVIAMNTQSVELAQEGSGIHMRIHLKDGRTYSVMMDLNGKVISKGF